MKGQQLYILLPPSEGKTYPQPAKNSVADGQVSFEDMLADLIFPHLESYRNEVAKELIKVSHWEDAIEVLNLSPRQTDLVERNKTLATIPFGLAAHIYTGVLFAQADLADCYVGKNHGDVHVLIASALYGMVEPEDTIAPYRLQMQVKLGDLGALATYWKPRLNEVLPGMLQGHLVLDARSGPYRKAWSPTKKQQESFGIDMREIVVREPRNGKLVTVSHHAKHMRGQITKALCLADVKPGEGLDKAVEVIKALSTVDSVDVSEAGKCIVITKPAN